MIQQSKCFKYLLLLLFLLIACGAQPDVAIVTHDSPTAVSSATPTRQPATLTPTIEASGQVTILPTFTPVPTEAATATPERSFAGVVPAPEFPAGLDWLNSGRPLSLAELRGKVVLLDFWTYGCVNCMHVMPELKRLEEKYANELVVIGVHSAKFTNEAETENIRRIILRYELEHPVVNDENFEIWTTYGASAWPTFVLIDPEGNVLGQHAGEGIYDLFDEIIGGMVAQFEVAGRIDRTPLSFILEKESLVDSPLLFPGKVLADEGNNRLYIADSNHNRIVITDLGGQVVAVIGNGRAGWQDGDYKTARFFRPQGLTLADANTLYVADTENHALRRVDLNTGLVTTVAGTGEQGRYRDFEGYGPAIALNSPWDVLYHEGMVYMAMAGQHQLWVYDPATEIVRAFTGSGREVLKDGSRLEAGLNQPSGLATDGTVLYVADSEASAIRTAAVENGRVTTIVGMGLFEFGDVDGVGDEVRLQHPLGVAYQDGLLYVADTYNSKIKIINPQTRETTSFLGGNGSGWRDGEAPLFDEPGGLSITSERLYIADTNNHVIRIADLVSGEVSTLVLVDNDGLLTRQPAGEDYNGKVVTLDSQTVAAGAGMIRLQVDLPAGYKFNELAPFTATWQGEAEAMITTEEQAVQVVAPSFPLDVTAVFSPGDSQLQADLVIYYCEAERESLCLIERVRLWQPLSVVEGMEERAVTVTYTVPAPPL